MCKLIPLNTQNSNEHEIMKLHKQRNKTAPVPSVPLAENSRYTDIYRRTPLYSLLHKLKVIRTLHATKLSAMIRALHATELPATDYRWLEICTPLNYLLKLHVVRTVHATAQPTTIRALHATELPATVKALYATEQFQWKSRLQVGRSVSLGRWASTGLLNHHELRSYSFY